MRRDILVALSVCASLVLGSLASNVRSLGYPEPILSKVDFRFASTGMESYPPGSVHAGNSVRILAHVALDGQQTWTKRGVVVDLGSPGEEDGNGVTGPSVLYDNGEYRMWYTGNDGVWPHGWILYANSSDGITWTKHGVVLSAGPPGEDANVQFPCVIKDGSIYRMWYSGFDGTYFRIFQASSADGLVWTRQGLAVDLGPAGSYDDYFVYSPFVILDGIYKMWYSGNDGSSVRILYAISSDGLTWTKQGLNLDLGPPGSLDSVHVSSNYVMKEGGGYHMWYRGYDGSHNRILYATSNDGLSWTRNGLAIDVGPPGSTDSVHLIQQSVMHLPGRPYQVWYGGRDATATERIHYANLTSVALPTNVEVGFYLDGVSPSNLMGANVTSVGALSSATAEINWTATSVGHHYIYAVIDPANKLPEIDEGNNTAFLQVDVVNNPPFADAGSDQTVFRNQVTILDGTGSNDPDGDPLSFVWVQTSGYPLLLLGGNTSNPLVFPFLSGVFTFSLTIHDDWGGFSTDTANLTVVNRPPTADAGSDEAASKRSVVQLNGTGSSDPDGDMLTFSWVQSSGPTVSLFGYDTAVPTFIPQVAGTYQFTLSVDDGDGGTDDDSVVVVVTNTGPVAEAGLDQVAPKYSHVGLDGTRSSDTDGDALTFAWVQTGGPSVVLIGAGSETPTFVPVVKGVYSFRLTVDDGDGGTATDSVNVTVGNRNPVAKAGQDKTIAKRTLVALEGHGSYDPDNDRLSYLWSQVGGPTVTLQGTNQSVATFIPPRSGTYIFNLTVDDGDGGKGYDTAEIIATNANPIANAGQDVLAQKYGLVTLNGVGSSDRDGDLLVFSWTQVSGPMAPLNGAGTATATFVPTQTGVYTFRLAVDDGDSGSATDTVMVTIWSMSPVAMITSNYSTAIVGGAIDFDGRMSSDPDGSIVDYSFDFGDGSQANGTAKLRSHSYSSPGAYTVTLTVTDNDGNKSSTSMAVKIEPPVPERNLLAETWWLLVLLVILVVVVVLLLFERRKWKKKASELESAKSHESERGEQKV